MLKHRPQAARAGLLLFLLLAHAALLVGWLQRPARTSIALPTRLLTRLVTPRVAAEPPPPRQAIRPPTLAAGGAGLQLPAPASPAAGTAASLAAPIADSGDASTAPPARARLQLDLPSSGSSSRRAALQRPGNPALSDPRSNSPRLSANERFALALGNLECVVDERQPDGSVQRHAGRFQANPSAVGSADPFGRSGSTGGNIGGDFSRGMGGGGAGTGSGVFGFSTCVKN